MELRISPRYNVAERTKESGLSPGVRVIGGGDGGRLMFMVTSNSYRDREQETILSAALRAYVESCWTADGQFVGEQMHTIWHAKELGGVSDLVYVDVWGAFLIEVWREQPTALARGFYDFVERHPEIRHGASHGFRYRVGDKDGGEYRAIEKFESSTLPLDAAANLLTFSGVIGMGKREDYFKQLFKESFGIEIDAEELRADFEAVVNKLRGLGVEHKGITPLTPDPSPTQVGRGEKEKVNRRGAEDLRLERDLGSIPTPDPYTARDLENGESDGDVMAVLVRIALDVGAMLERQEANQQAMKGLHDDVESLRDKSARLEAEQRLRPRADESEETALEGDEAAALLKAMSAKRVERFGVIEYEEV